MSSASKVRKYLREIGVSQYARYRPLDTDKSNCETVVLSYRGRRMLVKSPVKEVRGSLTVVSILFNLVSDASGYEEALGNFDNWKYLFDLDNGPESVRLFDTVKHNTLAFKELVGEQVYNKIIGIMNEAYGWS